MPEDLFEIKTFTQIETTLIDQIQVNQAAVVGRPKLTDFAVGSIIRSIVRALAAVLALFWTDLRDLVGSFYLSSATGLLLDRRMADFGFSRTRGQRSSGPIVIVRVSGDSYTGGVGVGDLLFDDKGNQFQIQTSSQVFGATSATVGIRTARIVSVDVAVARNLPVDARLTSNNPMYRGLQFIVGNALDNTTGKGIGTGITGGSPDESDPAVRARFKNFLGSLGRGTPDAIQNAVKAVTGVTDARVYERQILVSALGEGDTPIVQRSGDPFRLAVDGSGNALLDANGEYIANPGYDGFIVVWVQATPASDGSYDPVMQDAVEQAILANKAAGIGAQIQYPTPRFMDIKATVSGTANLVDTRIQADIRTAMAELLINGDFNVNQLQAKLTTTYGMDVTLAVYLPTNPDFTTLIAKKVGSVNTIAPTGIGDGEVFVPRTIRVVGT